MRLKKLFSTILLSLILLCSSRAQQVLSLEKVTDSSYRLYYDINYYLVEKDCEYKAIERVIGVDTRTAKLHGSFKDFDLNGRAILEGTYKDGLKEGVFKAYHPNGQLKWESNYKNDNLDGFWKYYYPDGKPMLTLLFKDNNFFIQDLYDKKGKHQIINGNGIYEMTMPIIGFTEHGYTAFSRSGKVSNGKPFGEWYVYFISPNYSNKKIFFAKETYTADFTISDVQKDEGFEHIKLSTTDFPFTPEDYFPRAEFFAFKNCTFDDYTGFSEYIATKFSLHLNREKQANDFKNMTVNDEKIFEEGKDLFLGGKDLLEGAENVEVTYSVNVSKKGLPSGLKIEKTSIKMDNLQKKRLLQSMLHTIPYYLPSYLDNNVITDKLFISFNIQQIDDRYFIPPVKITREKGH